MDSYQGFKIINLKYSKSSSETFQLFWKPHSVREYNAKKPGGRTLFIINIPAYITKQSLREMMEQFGGVSNVYLQKKPSTSAPPDILYPILDPEKLPEGFKVGYVVYDESESMQKAMDFPATKTLIATTKNPITTGLNKWFEEYNASFRSAEELRQEVELVMRHYDERKTQVKATDPDEEGWVTVTSKKKRSRPVEGGRTSKGPRRKRKKTTQLLNFYNFQKKETNMKHLEEKRKKFEEDGRRMALLRSSRKFRPL